MDKEVIGIVVFTLSWVLFSLTLFHAGVLPQ